MRLVRSVSLGSSQKRFPSSAFFNTDRKTMKYILTFFDNATLNIIPAAQMIFG